MLLGLFSWLYGCSREPAAQPGSLCTVDDGEGSFRVAKVLAIDNEGVHLRLYKNKWTQRPAQVDVDSLSLGSIHDKDGFGMGHLPLTKQAFAAWKPVVFATREIKADELEGYKMWKDGGGGYFGSK